MIDLLILFSLLAVFAIGSCTKDRINGRLNKTLKSKTEKSQTLISEEPYAAVVDFDEQIHLTCSKCFFSNPTNGKSRVDMIACGGCQRLYYCSKECEEKDKSDHQDECRFFRSFQEDKFPLPETRLICRIMTKIRRQPEWKAFNGRTFDSLVDHYELHKDTWPNSTEFNCLDYETKMFMGPETPDLETFFIIYCKIKMNAWPVNVFTPEWESRGTAIYLGLTALKHSCRPDAYLVPQGSKMILRTTNMKSVYNDKLTISYKPYDLPTTTAKRRKYFLHKYYFECKCVECEDTELDRKRSSGRPECCPNGWFTFDDPRCRICNQRVSRDQRDEAKEMNKRLASDRILDPLSAKELQDLYEEAEDILSDHNVFMLSLADRIVFTAKDIRTKIAFTEVTTPQIKLLSMPAPRAFYLYKRFILFYRAKHPEVEKALDEALESVKVAYGHDHEFTNYLQDWKEIIGSPE